MKKALVLLIVFLISYNYKYAQGTDLIKYVNPLIGTAKSTTISAMAHGGGSENNAQVQPNVTVPFGMTNWTPQTQNTELKCLASYYYKDTVITGFRGSHWLSGSCTQEYGSFSVMPVSGKLICNPNNRGSKFSHNNETARADYYKVNLEDYDITAELSANIRSGILRFTFNKEGEAHIVINPNSDEGEGFVKVIPENREIVGYNPVHRIYQGWGKSAGFSGYFVMKVEKTFEKYGTYKDDEFYEGLNLIQNKTDIGAYASFNVKKGEQIRIKIGSSFVSIDQARKNLESEIPDYDFDLVQNNLNKIWNELLSKIRVEGEYEDDKVKFYTAMYHAFQQPRVYSDVDGQYPRFDGNAAIDTIKSGNYYCDFSLWDTYRALHGLYNILIPEQHADMIKSLFIKAKAGGWMPIFPKWNSYTSAMIGDHAISVIAEAYVKGVIDLTEEEYQILKKNATETPSSYHDYVDGKGRRALGSYLKHGFIPLEDPVIEAFHHNEQVSRTLEYAYDDFALAQIAKKMNKKNDYDLFIKRSQFYRNVFDPSVNNMNGRYSNGSFKKDFQRDQRVLYICEGTPWQYNWYVPHDIEGLIKLMGGVKKFNEELDTFFEIGQYWHGNEPSHQIPYTYNYSGQPWKTQKIVAKTMSEEYGVGPGGLSGNEDAGQMSAWYIFGALGFYPVAPALPEYQICGPKFQKITIKLGTGNILEINAPAYTSSSYFIHDILLNNNKHKSYSLSHEIFKKGGKLDFVLSNIPKE
jgi:predicted alpha-1,2-mannosidase